MRAGIPQTWREEAEDEESRLLREEVRSWAVYERELVRLGGGEYGRGETR